MCIFCKNKKTAMESEIFEQSEILAKLIETHVSENSIINIEVPENINKVVLVASGSSYNTARYAADLFGNVACIEARAIYSSEFLLKSAVPQDKDILYIFITQSGETSDTNSALNRAKEFGVLTYAVTNKKDSTIWNAANYKIDCQAGEEKSIAATKSLTAQMLCLTFIVLKYANVKNIDIQSCVEELQYLPKCIDATYALQGSIKKIAKFLSKYKDIIVTADGISYAIAREIALKTKETSYINASAAILGEFMHGHVAVLNSKKIPLIYIETGDLSYSAMKNLNKIKEDYNPPVILIGNSNDKVDAKFCLNIYCESEITKSFGIMVVGQILALEIAKCLNRNVDKPKGLNKVVK